MVGCADPSPARAAAVAPQGDVPVTPANSLIPQPGGAAGAAPGAGGGGGDVRVSMVRSRLSRDPPPHHHHQPPPGLPNHQAGPITPPPPPSATRAQDNEALMAHIKQVMGHQPALGAPGGVPGGAAGAPGRSGGGAAEAALLADFLRQPASVSVDAATIAAARGAADAGKVRRTGGWAFGGGGEGARQRAGRRMPARCVRRARTRSRRLALPLLPPLKTRPSRRPARRTLLRVLPPRSATSPPPRACCPRPSACA
jgi:hypothetical protein